MTFVLLVHITSTSTGTTRTNCISQGADASTLVQLVTSTSENSDFCLIVLQALALVLLELVVFPRELVPARLYTY